MRNRERNIMCMCSINKSNTVPYIFVAVYKLTHHTTFMCLN